MSLDKAIEHGQERRKPYQGAKRIDRTCRNHGTCSWCINNRMHKFKKQDMAADDITCERHKNNRKSKRHFDDIDDEGEDSRQ